MSNLREVNATIVSPLESNGAIPINIQDQHTRAFDIKFALMPNTTTITVQANPDDNTITVSGTTGFVDGIAVRLNSVTDLPFIAHQVGAIAGNVVTLDTPVDRTFPNGSSVQNGSHHMNVDGSGTTQIFSSSPIPSGLEIDVVRFMGYIQDGSTMDDALFGGIAALTNGVVLRQNNGVLTNHWTVKSNGDISLICFDASYSDKAPSGSYGYKFRSTYGGQNKHGVTIRLEPGETLEVLIQDDLTGLEDFQMLAQGHVVTD